MALFCFGQELAEDWAKTLEHIVDWSAFGCDKTAADSTIWLGTEGSHTPLHYDTYGVNLVSCTFSSSAVVGVTNTVLPRTPLGVLDLPAAHAGAHVHLFLTVGGG